MPKTSHRNIAAFVNVDSLVGRHGADLHAADIVRELGRFGQLQAAFAYADWAHQRRLQKEFDDAAFRLITVPRAYIESDGVIDERHATLVDQAFRISLDALEFALSHPRIDTIAIAGASPLYAQVSTRLRAHGMTIIGIGPEGVDCAPWVSSCHRYVHACTMLGKKLAGATFEEGQQRIVRLITSRGVDTLANQTPDAIYALLVEADPAFDPRNYGCADFDTWYSKYVHLLLPSPADGSDRRKPMQSSLATPPRPGSADSVTRAILMRALVDASWRGFPMSLARFRDVVETVAPDFDEISFGFLTFIECLAAFPDLVIVDRDSWQVLPNDGVIPCDPPRPRTRSKDRGARSEDRRRPRADSLAPDEDGPTDADLT